MPTPQQDLEFQLAQAGLRASVEGRLTAAMRAVAGSSPEQFRNTVIGVTQLLVREYGQAAGQFAADWYTEMRLQAGAAGAYVATAAVESFDVEVEQTVRRAVAPLFADSPDFQSVIDSIVVKAGQYAVQPARDTIARNSYRDPAASGWRRIAHGATCDFCLMLVGRGGVYKEATATFKPHAHCDCTASPSWDLNAPEVPTIAYQASARTSGMTEAQRAANNARIQAWIADNQSELADLRASL